MNTASRTRSCDRRCINRSPRPAACGSTGRVGESLERLSDDRLDRRLPELADHFLEAAPAGVAGKAVSYAMQASDAALRSLAFEDAATLCRRAQAALAIARAQNRRARRAIVRLRHHASSRPGALPRRSAGRSKDLAERVRYGRDLDDAARMAEAMLAINRGFFSRIGRTDHEVAAALEHAIAAQPPDDDPVLARLLAALASELVWSDEGDRRYELSDDALAMARRIGDERTIAHVLLLRDMTISSPDTLAQRVAESRGAPVDRRVATRPCPRVPGRVSKQRDMDGSGERRRPRRRWLNVAGRTGEGAQSAQLVVPHEHDAHVEPDLRRGTRGRRAERAHDVGARPTRESRRRGAGLLQ